VGHGLADGEVVRRILLLDLDGLVGLHLGVLPLGILEAAVGGGPEGGPDGAFVVLVGDGLHARELHHHLAQVEAFGSDFVGVVELRAADAEFDVQMALPASLATAIDGAVASGDRDVLHVVDAIGQIIERRLAGGLQLVDGALELGLEGVHERAVAILRLLLAPSKAEGGRRAGGQDEHERHDPQSGSHRLSQNGGI